ncbi:hypothetical protein FH972_017698 [Carpinus fangiana]|uniref:Uncharacterized protein n=1 Tax=Carpinus fangiana TaxID=176857 RepID=A0A5N6RJN0_9ROSI|nr:hypothetical protein FH972_017698 [Carpinus fangiana]
MCSLIPELLKRHERVVSHELRGEVDAGIERLDVVLSTLKGPELGQGSWVAGRIPKHKRTFKPKKNYWAHKKAWARKKGDVGSGSGPKGVEATLALERPRACENSTEREAGSTACLGSMVVISCLDGFRRHPAMGSSSKQTSDDQVRAVKDSGDVGLLRSASELTREATWGISGGLGQSEEGLGMSEEGSTSYVKETEDATGMMGKEVSMSSDGLGCTAEVVMGPNSKPKPLQVYQRKDVKPKKQRGPSLGEGVCGAIDAPTMLLADRGENARERPEMGLSEQSGILGAYMTVVGEKLDDGASLGDAVLCDSLWANQDSLAAKLDSPAAEELKLALEASGLAGLSCDG